MIYYQLPNGNGVYLTVEQILNLSHQDIQGMVIDGVGSPSNNPFRKLNTPSPDDDNQKDDDDYEDNYEEDYYDDIPDMLSDGDDEPLIEFDIDQIPDS